MMIPSPPKHILTLPLWGNYGGLLQAYALWRALSLVAPPALVAEYPYVALGRRLRGMLREAHEFLPLLLGCARPGAIVPRLLRRAVARRWTRRMGLCRVAAAEAAPAAAWVVGSDQVWRADYARDVATLPFFFLDFLPEELRRRSVAYAASFGRDEWMGTAEETARCRELLRQFKAVSVREESGVRICREIFGVEAVQMPDPTLLLERREYEGLMGELPSHWGREPYVAAYVLDETPEALRALQLVSGQLGLAVRHLMPRATAGCLRECLPLAVPQWLRALGEAECVVTDSFHGCVFSMLFHKPFVCLGNERRGAARFESLLRTFGLEGRLVAEPEQVAACMQESVDWVAVEAQLAGDRERGLAFLCEHLS